MSLLRKARIEFSAIGDFEDAVMAATAANNRMDCIITRNIRDYTRTDFPVYTPERFLALIGQGKTRPRDPFA